MTAEQISFQIQANNEWITQCNKRHRVCEQELALTARMIRQDRGISLRDFAKLLGVSPVYLSDLERGNRSWSDEFAVKWLEAMKNPSNK